MKILKFLAGAIIAGLVLVGGAEMVFAEDVGCFLELFPNRGFIGSAPMLNDVKLDGVAEGGELVLVEMLNSSPRYIRIATQAGEPAEVVIARTAATLSHVSPFNSYLAERGRRNEKGEIVRDDGVPIYEAEGNLIKSFGGSPGSYIFAGTETGLGIPPPPTSLTVRYNPELEEVSLFWENPDPPYGGVAINAGAYQGVTTTMSMKAPPPRKEEVPPGMIAPHRVRANKGLRRFDVIGCRNGVLSNAAVITLNYQDRSQEELDAQPFTGGIAPNWKRWSQGAKPDMLVLEEGTKGERKRFDQEPPAALVPDDKRFYQSIKTRSSEVTGGTWRKFLALQPGHTYRLSTRMNTFDMDKAQGDWSFSFHAAAHPAGVTLTPEQMAGSSPLPNGDKGPTAGRIVAFGPSNTTKGKFVEVSTKKPDPHSSGIDIVVPEGAEVITVWFKYNGPASEGVGFDWIKLQDVTGK